MQCAIEKRPSGRRQVCPTIDQLLREGTSRAPRPAERHGRAYGVDCGADAATLVASTTNAPSGSQTTRSASQPGGDAALCVARGPRGAAGRAHIHSRPTSAIDARAARAPRPHRRERELQRRDAAPRREEVAARRPSARADTANGRTRRDRSSPSIERLPTSASRSSRSRIGGAHLNSVAPSGISSAANVR